MNSGETGFFPASPEADTVTLNSQSYQSLQRGAGATSPPEELQFYSFVSCQSQSQLQQEAIIEDNNLSEQVYDSIGNNASEVKSNSGPISMDFDAEMCEMETL